MEEGAATDRPLEPALRGEGGPLEHRGAALRLGLKVEEQLGGDRAQDQKQCDRRVKGERGCFAFKNPSRALLSKRP